MLGGIAGCRSCVSTGRALRGQARTRLGRTGLARAALAAPAAAATPPAARARPCRAGLVSVSGSSGGVVRARTGRGSAPRGRPRLGQIRRLEYHHRRLEGGRGDWLPGRGTASRRRLGCRAGNGRNGRARRSAAGGGRRCAGGARLALRGTGPELRWPGRPGHTAATTAKQAATLTTLLAGFLASRCGLVRIGL